MVLKLAHTLVSDSGLKRLHGLTALDELDLTGTEVTAAGVASLKEAIPACRVVVLFPGEMTDGDDWRQIEFVASANLAYIHHQIFALTAFKEEHSSVMRG